MLEQGKSMKKEWQSQYYELTATPISILLHQLVGRRWKAQQLRSEVEPGKKRYRGKVFLFLSLFLPSRSIFNW